jgi:ABC-type transport system involved in multi-copper enzyme maturation permease subunit
MQRYVHADLKRIRRKKSHFIVLLCIYLVIALIAVFNCSTGNLKEFQSMADIIAGTLTIYFGIVVFFAVFSADTRTRTMQIAIGSGLSRSQVVWSKELEGLILAVVYDAIAALILCLVPVIFHAGLPASFFSAIAVSTIQSILETMVFYNISMIVIFATLHANYAEILYIMFSFEIITGIFTVLFGYLNTQFGFPDLSGILFSSLSASFFADPLNNLLNIVGIAVYLILPIYLSQLVFRKKELEF